MKYRIAEMRAGNLNSIPCPAVFQAITIVYKYKFLEIYGRFLDGFAAFLYHN